MKIINEIHRIKQVMGLLTEQDKDDLDSYIIVYPNGVGVELGDKIPTSDTYYIPLKNVLPNEIFKDQDYFLQNDNVQDMNKTIQDGGELEPIIAIPHPEDQDKYLVMDGHHRRYAYEYFNKVEIPVRIARFENILLGDENGKVLSSLDKELGNKEMLDKYFVSLDGSHQFDDKL